jgi:hypothetical protein
MKKKILVTQISIQEFSLKNKISHNFKIMLILIIIFLSNLLLNFLNYYLYKIQLLNYLDLFI